MALLCFSRYTNPGRQDIIANVQFATKQNISAFTRISANTVEGAMKEPRRLFKQLGDAGLITPIPLYGFGRSHSRNTFHRVTHKGHRAVESPKYRYIDPKSINNIYHQSGLIDVALGFIYGFPDYKVEIDYNKILDGYRPDAHIRLTSKDIRPRIYDFIIEFERTRSNQAIIDEKLKRNEKLAAFRKYGLSDKTKILYVLTDEFYDVYWRPVEYNQKEVRQLTDKVNYRLKRLIGGARFLPGHKYRFTALHNFTRLDKAVWHNSQGHPTKLINDPA